MKLKNGKFSYIQKLKAMNQIEQPRRKFLQTGVVGFCIALFAISQK